MLILAAVTAAAGTVPTPHPRPKNTVQSGKKPAFAPPPQGAPAGDLDMSKAVPLKEYLRQHPPSAADQFKTLSGELARNKPALETARKSSENLARETAALQKKLIDSAARVGFLETETLRIDAEVARLEADYAKLSPALARDRVAVSKLLAMLERLQHDVPPAMAVRSGDALAAARSAMLIGASLPRVYRDAGVLAARINALRQTRTTLIRRRADAAHTAVALKGARGDLDRLLAIKRQQADAAATRYGVLKTQLGTIASKAINLQVLLRKVAQLRAAPVNQPIITVNAPASHRGEPGRFWLRAPVAGGYTSGGVDGVGGTAAPGITYFSLAGATVIAPADGAVVFAGSLPKAGRILILDVGGGYDAILAGMDRLEVRPGNTVLAGEPVGVMPKFDHEPRLYFELRQKNGRGMSPAPFVAVALRKAK